MNRRAGLQNRSPYLCLLALLMFAGPALASHSALRVAPKLFASRGGESLAAVAAIRVSVASGRAFVSSQEGQEPGRIDVPERPLQVLVGDRTLVIFSNHALNAIELAG